MAVDSELLRQVEEIKKTALNKRIYEKARQVARRFGKKEEYCYKDCNRGFVECTWTLTRGDLLISYADNGNSGYSILIRYKDKEVFTISYIGPEVNVFSTYISSHQWEGELDALSKLIEDEEDRIKEKNLREHFGL